MCSSMTSAFPASAFRGRSACSAARSPPRPWPWRSSSASPSGWADPMTPDALHVPVLLDRCVALLAPALTTDAAGDGAVVVDATLGLGGHSEAMLERFPDVRLVGLDRDPEALRLSTERLAPYAERVTLVHAVYD